MEIDEDNLTRELSNLLNRYNADNWANTPDFILAEHLMGCLRQYRATLEHTRTWHRWPTLAEKLRQRPRFTASTLPPEE